MRGKLKKNATNDQTCNNTSKQKTHAKSFGQQPAKSFGWEHLRSMTPHIKWIFFLEDSETGYSN